MENQLQLVLRYLRKVWLHRTLALIVAGVLSGVGWLSVLLMPDVYEASTRVYVDRNSMMGQLLQGLAADTTGVDLEFLRVARTTLTSRPNLERVARETDLAILARTPAEMDELLDRLRGSINLASQGTARGRENLISIAYEHRDAKLALAVVKSLLDIFMESVLGSQQRDTLNTREFLDDQVENYRRRLEQTETNLKNFRRDNITNLPQQGSGYFRDYQNSSRERDAAQMNLLSAERLRDALRAQIQQLRSGQAELAEASAGEASDAQAALDALVPLDEDAQRVQDQIDAMLGVYTENHPDVQLLKRRLEAMKASSSEAPPDAADGESLVSLLGGGVPDELLVELSRAEALVASASAAVQTHETRMGQMMNALTTMPEIEAELTRLTREYEQAQRQYQAFLERRESAEISREADLSTDRDVFRIVDPPHVPTLPVGPNRGLLLSVVFMLALGTGAGLAFLRTVLQHTFSDSTELRERTGLYVLGRVGLVRTEAEGRRRLIGYAFYSGVFAALFGAYIYLVLAVGLDVLPFPDEALRARLES